MPTPSRRIGLWLIGPFGGVGTTVAVGLAALSRKLTPPTGVVTSQAPFAALDLDGFETFVLGGHDIRRGSFTRTAAELNDRSGMFSYSLIRECEPTLEEWTANVRPGTVIRNNDTIKKLAELPEVQSVRTAQEAIERIQADLRDFRKRHQLDQVVVVNVASTESPFELGAEHQTWDRLQACLDRTDASPLPASAAYALAAIEMGLPYINFTPSTGASMPALEELAKLRGVPTAGKDGKTGETLIKAALAPLFLARNLEVLSWVGHNILGGGDGRTLADPQNKASKVGSKDSITARILGYKPQTHVSIEYVESLDDWKTAWDHIHFAGFLGTKMVMQFTWQGCDSILAAPLVIDLVRLTLLAQRRGETGVLKHLACFFKSPIGVTEHDFFKQYTVLLEYAAKASRSEPALAETVTKPDFAARRELVD